MSNVNIEKQLIVNLMNLHFSVDLISLLNVNLANRGRPCQHKGPNVKICWPKAWFSMSTLRSKSKSVDIELNFSVERDSNPRPFDPENSVPSTRQDFCPSIKYFDDGKFRKYCLFIFRKVSVMKFNRVITDENISLMPLTLYNYS